MGTGQGGLGPPNIADSLFRMTTLPTMDRFMKTPEFAPTYFKNLKQLADSFFSPGQMNVFLDQLLNTYVPQGTLDIMKNFNAGRASYVLSQIPLTLTVNSSLPIANGYPRATSARTSNSRALSASLPGLRTWCSRRVATVGAKTAFP